MFYAFKNILRRGLQASEIAKGVKGCKNWPPHSRSSEALDLLSSLPEVWTLATAGRSNIGGASQSHRRDSGRWHAPNLYQVQSVNYEVFVFFFNDQKANYLIFVFTESLIKMGGDPDTKKVVSLAERDTSCPLLKSHTMRCKDTNIRRN